MQPKSSIVSFAPNLQDCCPNGAAIIDSLGVETPITEAMIRQALDALEHATWINVYQPSAGHETLVAGVAA